MQPARRAGGLRCGRNPALWLSTGEFQDPARDEPAPELAMTNVPGLDS